MSIAKPYPFDSYARIEREWYLVLLDCGPKVKLRPIELDTAAGFTVPDHWIEEVTMARPRKTAEQKKAEEAAKVTNSLLDAVQFCAPGFKEDGETYSTHAMIYGGWITTYNGIVMYGSKIDTPMQAMPHYGSLLAAIKATTGDTVQITQVTQDKLSVKGKGFKTTVKCLTDYSLVTRSAPDSPVGMIDSRMREGFEIMRQIARKSGETVLQSAVLIRNGDMIATDRQLLGMFWHGIGFPDVAVPADFVEAVLKVAKPMVSFGYTPGQSLTFYFDDESFVRTQLYNEAYPDVSRAIPQSWEGMTEIPAELFTGLKRIAPFIDKSRRCVWLNTNELSSNGEHEDATTVAVQGVADCRYAIDLERMLKLDGRITHWNPHSDKTIFQGANFRGVLCNFVTEDSSKGEPDPAATHTPATYQELPASSTPEQVATHFAQLGGGTPEYVEGPDSAPQYQPPQPVQGEDDGDPVDEPGDEIEAQSHGAFTQWTMPS